MDTLLKWPFQKYKRIKFVSFVTWKNWLYWVQPLPQTRGTKEGYEWEGQRVELEIPHLCVDPNNVSCMTGGGRNKAISMWLFKILRVPCTVSIFSLLEELIGH